MWSLIIAGGKGERLLPLTANTCKPMVPIAGKPLLHHQTSWLIRNGITDVIFLSGYMAEKIEDYFGDGADFGFNAHYSPEDSPLGRGGAVKQGMKRLPESVGEAIVINGDIITPQNLQPIIALHRETEATATLMLTPYISEFGIVDIDESDSVTGFIEKGQLPFWINAGIYVFQREIQRLLPDIGDHETETFPHLASCHQMRGYRSSAPWVSVDSFKNIAQAEAIINA